MRSKSKKSRVCCIKNESFAARRCRMEQLEDRRVLAAYAFDTSYVNLGALAEAQVDGGSANPDPSSGIPATGSESVFVGTVNSVGDSRGTANAENAVLAQFAQPVNNGQPIGPPVYIPTIEALSQAALVANALGLGLAPGTRNGLGNALGGFVVAGLPAAGTFHGTLFVAAYGETNITNGSDGLNYQVSASIGIEGLVDNDVYGYEVFADYNNEGKWTTNLDEDEHEMVEIMLPFTIDVVNDNELEFSVQVGGHDSQIGVNADGSTNTQWELVAAAWGYVTPVGQDLPQGDVDGDGDVDEVDLDIIEGNIGWDAFPGGAGAGVINGPATRIRGDLNSDGDVDQDDVDIWVNSADQFIVSNDGDVNDGIYGSGELTLREALSLADSGDQISFAPGISEIQLSNGQLTVADDVEIIGPGQDALTIIADTSSRAFLVNSNIDATISGLTITGGSVATQGGGIFASSGSGVTLDDVRLTDNFASNAGGGVYAAGDVTITNSTIDLNESGNAGGGVSVANTGHLSMIDTTVDDNDAVYGGGLYADLGYSDAIDIAGSTFSANDASGIGGAMLIQQNSGSGRGGTIVNSTISGNHSAAVGGVRFAYGATFDVRNTTIARNQGDSGGGVSLTGTSSSSTTVTIHNTIVAENRNAADSANNDVSGNLNTGSSYNLLGLGGPGGLTGGSNGNIVLMGAATAGLENLADNGGPTKTHALVDTSLAVDAGSNAIATAIDLVFDQRGFDRFVDGDSDLSEEIDIGAVEMAFE